MPEVEVDWVKDPGQVAVLGAGPAGLTAAYALSGGHRFFTKSAEVEALWHEVLGDEFLLRPRLSRIYWNGRFLDYPLRGADVVRKLGVVELTRVSASYARAALRPKGD